MIDLHVERHKDVYTPGGTEKSIKESGQLDNYVKIIKLKGLLTTTAKPVRMSIRMKNR